MKHILLACILSSGIMASPIFVKPAEAQTQIESMQDMAHWMNDAMQIQTDMMTLFSSDMMAEMYSVLNAGDLDAVQKLGLQFEAERQAVLARSSRQINELSPPEKWKISRSIFSQQDRATYAAAKLQYDSLQETYTLFEDLTGALSEILNAPESNDETALENLVDVQYKASVRLIELENQQVDGYLAAIPKNNPNHQFQKIVKQFNLAAIPELDISLKAENLKERQAFAKVMGKELDKIRPLIREGQKNTQREIRNVENLKKRNLSAADSTMIPILDKLYGTFSETFAIEAQMLDAMQSSQELYLSDKSDDEIESQIDENDLAYFALLEKRFERMEYRLSLLQ